MLMVVAGLPLIGSAERASATPTGVVTDLGVLPGDDFSNPRAVNNAGQVVGISYKQTAGSPSHGFSWTQAGGMVDIGGLGGTHTDVSTVSETGQVVGTSCFAQCTDGNHAFSWTQATGMTDIGTFGGTSSHASDVNDNGQVVGWAFLSGNGHAHALSWTSTGGSIDLGTLGGVESEAYAVNNSGTVVGGARVSSGEMHAFVWTPANGMTDLGTLGGSDSSAWAVNESGQVAGYSYVAGGALHGFFWSQATGMIDVGTLGGQTTEPAVGRFALGASGDVVGVSNLPTAGVSHAFEWTLAGGMRDLGVLAGSTSEAEAVNANGVVVGSSSASVGADAFAWSSATGLIDLPSLGGSQSGAVDVNDSGLVVGSSTTHAVVWHLVDLTPPSITVAAPVDGDRVEIGQTALADYTCVDDTADSGLATCDGTVASGSPIDTSSLGVHSFTVTATDNAGNSASVTHTYTVLPPDTTPPIITLSTPADGALIALGQNVHAGFSCADNVGGWGIASCVGSVANGAAISTSSLGAHSVTVTATDNAGNSSSVTNSYTVLPPDTTAPTATIATPNDGAFITLGADVHADFSCADDVGGWGIASCIGPVAEGAPIDTSSAGVHPFTVTATDNAGNSSSVTHNYTVRAPDLTPPTIAVSSPADGEYFAKDQVVAADFSCVDDPGGWGIASCAGPVTDGSAIDTSSVGAHSFVVTATDEAGNSSSVTDTYTVVEPKSASSDLPFGGGSVTTDSGAGVSPLDPVATTVNSPNEGIVAIEQGAVSQTVPSGFNLLGLQMHITAPPAAADVPLTLVFDVDAAMLPVGETKDSLSILKDGGLVPDCLGAAIVPDGVTACVSARDDAPSGGGDVRLIVISISASIWNLAVGEPTAPVVTAHSTSISEGNSATKPVAVSVTLNAPAAVPVSVDWSTANATAVAPSDYASASGTLTFAPGQTAKSVNITINGDTTVEPGQTFDVVLSHPAGVVVGGPSAVVTILDDDLPLAPSALTVAPGNGQATVTWSAPAGYGSAVTGYAVTPYLGTVAQATRVFPTAATSRQITGLTNAKAYTFRVATRTANGTGAKSAPSSTVVVGSPTAPSSVVSKSASTTAATGSLIVTFTLGATNGSPIATQIPRCVSSNGGVTKSGVHSGAAAAPITVSGVNTAKAYTCTVSATNARGTGPISTASTGVTVGAPAQPAKPTVVKTGVGALKVTFTAPLTNGAAITSYRATCTSSNGGATRSVNKATGPITLTGLSVAKSYTCAVSTTNGRGTGPPSTPSATISL